MIVSGLVFVLGAGLVIAAVAASTSDGEAGFLHCNEYVLSSSVGSDQRAPTAEDAVISSEWWEFAELPSQSREIATDQSPEFGVVKLDPQDDGVESDAEARGGAEFLVYADAKAIAWFAVDRDPEDKAYFVEGLAYC